MLSANFFAFLALIVWGGWGLFSKFATLRMPPIHASVYEVAGAMLVALSILIYLLVSHVKLNTDPQGIFYAMLTGVCMSLGGVLFLIALSRGNAYIVTVVTSLYPIVTLLLLYIFFREAITLKQGLGMILALAGVLLLVI